MATSEYAAFIRHSTTHLGDGYPLDAALYKDVVRNNLNHVADELGQQLVNFVCRSSSELTTGTPAAINTWYPIVTCGPFMLTCRSNGVPYPIVVRLAGFASTANNITLRVVVAPRGQSAAQVQAAVAPSNIIEATTSSTSAAWLSPSPYIATVSAELANEMVESIAVCDAVSGASPRHRTAVRAEISVWGSTANVSAVPTLSGLSAREYIGEPPP